MQNVTIYNVSVINYHVILLKESFVCKCNWRVRVLKMGRPKYVDSPCNNENNCESISGQAKHVITSSLSPLSCTSGINRHDNTSPEPVESSLASHSSNTPTHLHFSKSKNVDLRTMRMVNQATLAGYNPFRGDFEVEFDNNAENLVCLARSLDDHKNLNSENQTKQTKLSNKLLTELQIVLGECYNSHLKERQKRKEIIKNYGLMNRKGHHRWCTKLQVGFISNIKSINLKIVKLIFLNLMLP